MYGATAAKVAYSEIDLTTNQACCNLVINPLKADSLYVYYYLSNVYSELHNLAIGAAQQNLSVRVISDFPIILPPLEEQKRIANILSALDNKIELNRRINENLEQQAQVLFKHWFVDFAPFKDNNFIESEIGMIPKGWRVVELGDVTTITKDKVGNRSDVKVLSPISTGELMLSEEYFNKQVFSESIAKYILVRPNSFAYNPARINIGSIGRNTFDFDGCVSPVYVVFECEKGYHYFFDLYRRLSIFKEEVIKRSIGGVRQTLNYTDFSLIKVVYPPLNVVSKFNVLYEHLLQYKKLNSRENEYLSNLRDILLPKLMSGELNIDE